tara:strand:+ start:1061 stop:1726 length:666 start_codon:yes stop_codon:yes gene_type:complete
MPVVETGQDQGDDAALVEEQAKIDQARSDLYDEAAGNQPAAPEDNLILGKYQSQADLVDAYKNLQRENERLRTGEVEQPEVDSPDREEEQEQGNQLTAEDAGRIRDNVFGQVGGQDRYQALMGWASQNIDEARTQAFNDALQSGNEGAILSQLKGIQYDHMMATGYEPKLTGGRAPTNEVQGYSSEAQVIRAMQDPRYQDDPAYIKEVEQRIAVSNVFNKR